MLSKKKVETWSLQEKLQIECVKVFKFKFRCMKKIFLANLIFSVAVVILLAVVVVGVGGLWFEFVWRQK